MFNLQNSLDYNIRIFRAVGLWHTENSTLIYKLFTFYVIFSIYSLNIAVIIGLCYMPNLQAFMDVFYLTVSCFIIGVKSVHFIRYNRVFQQLTKGIDQKHRPKISDRQNKILVEYMNRWNIFFFITTVIIPCLGSSSVIITPIISHKLPMEAKYGVDYMQPGYYEAFFTQQAISMTLIIFIHLNCDGVVSKLMAYAAGELLVLQDCLENIYEMTKKVKNVESNEKILKEMNGMLIDLIEYHKEICLYTEKLEKFYNPYMMFQICISAPSIAMTMFKMSSFMDSERENMFAIIQPAIYICGVLFDFFAFCFFGSQVTFESGNVTYAAFKCDWLDAPMVFKKNLLFFIHRSEKPIKLRVFYLLDFSLQTYASIIRSSYSYFALLQQFKDY